LSFRVPIAALLVGVAALASGCAGHPGIPPGPPPEYEHPPLPPWDGGAPANPAKKASPEAVRGVLPGRNTPDLGAAVSRRGSLR
jgi:hypothetical protein